MNFPSRFIKFCVIIFSLIIIIQRWYPNGNFLTRLSMFMVKNYALRLIISLIAISLTLMAPLVNTAQCNSFTSTCVADVRRHLNLIQLQSINPLLFLSLSPSLSPFSLRVSVYVSHISNGVA